MSTELEIRMGADLIGMLDGTDRRNLRVVYDERWVNRVDATPLSVSLPVAGRAHGGRRVAAYLWGLLPDNDRVLARWASAAQCSASDVFALLGAVGSDVAGAARYVVADAQVPSSEDGFMTLQEADIAQLLADVRSDATAWHPRNQGQWSLAGAQAKIALAFDDTKRIWGIPTGTRPTTHILKPGIAGLDEHHINEHLCMAAARRLGLRVAHTSVQQFAAERALVVQRYDRVRVGATMVRVHQEDCCQALGIHPQQKYQAEGGPSVEDIATLLRSVEPTDAGVDVETLLRAAGFNWLILGTDAHAKNYSLLLSGPQVRLAPLYDIASMAAYGAHPKRLRLAQKVGGEYRPAAIHRRHWEQLAVTTQIDAEQLISDLTVMAINLPDVLATLIAETELVHSERAVAQKLLDAIAPWATGCVKSLK